MWPSNLIIFDSTGFNYYRVTATLSWAKKANIQPNLDNPQFINSLKGQYFGSINKFLKLYDSLNKSNLNIKDCWAVRDGPTDQIWRQKYYSNYKANRTEQSQIGPLIKYLNELTEQYFAHTFRLPSMEADDIIACLVKITSQIPSVQRITIITLDSDFNQLLTDSRVQIFNPKPDWHLLDITPEHAFNQLQQKIYQGDPSDNVKSVTDFNNRNQLIKNAQLIDFNYIPRDLINLVAKATNSLLLQTAEPKLENLIPVNFRPRNIQLGLCCLNITLREKNIYSSRTMILKTIQSKGIDELIHRCRNNLLDLIQMIEWNAKNGIRVFRLSSEIFPHYANPQSPRYSLDLFQPLLSQIGNLARHYSQRLTFHPDHFNVIGTPDKDKFHKTVLDLDYQAEVLDRMGCDQDSVMVVHGGGQYGNKLNTINRWIQQFKMLPERVRRRLVLENCEKNFNIEDCLYVSQFTGIPVVFDTHHYECYNLLHPSHGLQAPDHYVPQILDTWIKRGIKPKFHVSEQGTGQIGHHSDYIELLPKYLLEIPTKYQINIDIMIEAKKKELAVFRLYQIYPEIDPRLDYYPSSEMNNIFEKPHFNSIPIIDISSSNLNNYEDDLILEDEVTENQLNDIIIENDDYIIDDIIIENDDDIIDDIIIENDDDIIDDIIIENDDEIIDDVINDLIKEDLIDDDIIEE